MMSFALTFLFFSLKLREFCVTQKQTPIMVQCPTAIRSYHNISRNTYGILVSPSLERHSMVSYFPGNFSLLIHYPTPRSYTLCLTKLKVEMRS